MTHDDVKTAFNLAEKEIKKAKQDEQDAKVNEVKEIVKRTLQEIETLKEQRDEIDEKLKILKLDIEDLKTGKLERIQERQDKDPLAKQVSLIIIIKDTHTETIRETTLPSPWYQPYHITWNTPYYGGYQKMSTLGNDNFIGYSTYTTCNTPDDMPLLPSVFTLTNSIVKDNAGGTYQIKKKIVHLR